MKNSWNLQENTDFFYNFDKFIQYYTHFPTKNALTPPPTEMYANKNNVIED